MALTVDGIPVSGSIGLTTFSRNRFGAYKRRRTTPVNPNSAGQQIVRNAFRAAVDHWTTTLTDLQRSGWDTWAAGTPWLNKAGQVVHLTGQNAFVRFFTFYYIQNAAPPALLTAPGIFNTGSLAVNWTSITYDLSANTVAIVIDAPVATNDFQVTNGLVTALISQPANASVNFRPNRFALGGTQIIGAVPAAAIAFGATPSPFVYAAGQIAWLKIRALTIDNRLSTEQLLGPIPLTVVA